MTSEMVIQTEGLTERFGNITAVGDLSTGISHIGSLQSGFHRSLLGNSIILDSVQAFAGRR